VSQPSADDSDQRGSRPYDDNRGEEDHKMEKAGYEHAAKLPSEIRSLT